MNHHRVRDVVELAAYRPGVLMDICEAGPDGRLQLVRIEVDVVRVARPPLPVAMLYVAGLAADRVRRHVWVTVAG